ncbi:Protein of uncharacterised function (DUF3108) [Porphyromonas macacae]|uniref:Protein of uncharacterized function (DUF3108) n=1 Tax=Porphyromonas macacae TaxID=28115 RepID=A0A379E8V3_9PORP|nr:DUF3108 domain-containing protein [Porphyromonas macacae]SUB89105.1 Protein of uncharacterised function (DUF3108) [Porphyromonas macacae]
MKQYIRKDYLYNRCSIKVTHKLFIITVSLFTLIILNLNNGFAQIKLDRKFINNKEEITYSTYFKWGILKPRAGNASMTLEPYQKGYRAQIKFATSSFFDNFYKMRDTIDCHYDQELKLYKASKRTDDDNVMRIDDYTFNYAGNKTIARFRRYKNGELTADSVINSPGGMDMVALVMDARNIDWENAKIGTAFDYNIFSGPSIVPVSLRLEAHEIIEIKKQKYKSYRIAIYVKDSAFESGGEKADTYVWFSADKNKILLQGSMELKVGYAKININQIRSHQYPLECKL